MSLLALFGHGAMSDLSPLCVSKLTLVDQSEFMASRPRRDDVARVRFRGAGFHRARRVDGGAGADRFVTRLRAFVAGDLPA